MESVYLAILFFATLILLLITKLLFSKSYNPDLKFPPGPKPWPIIGNLNLIGPLPHQSLHKLSQTYGPIMQLKFGSYPVVIASSPELARQILRTQDYVFASKPQWAAGKYTAYNFRTIAWAPQGPHWREARKLCETELFNSKSLETFEYIRVEENHAFLSRLCALSGKPITLKDHLSRMNLSIISRVVLGKKYFSTSEFESSIVTLDEFQDMLEQFFFLNGVLNLGDWVTWLQSLDLQGYVKRMKALKKKFDIFFDHVFGEHMAKKEGATEFVPHDLVDVLLKLADDSDTKLDLNHDSFRGITQDLIAGGTGAAATSVEWAMSELMKQPHLIEKATEELDRVIGRERWVKEKDMPELPYIDSIMKETMRKHPVAVMLAPHLALEDCNVEGYDIRKGTRVFINTWSIGRNSSIWEAPEEFKPERFLGKAIDVKGHNFELLPFGSGRRMCPGYSLGLKLIRSSIANMLHGFKWKLPENMKPEDLNMDEVYGLATTRKYPLVAVVEPKLPIHLYQI